MKVTIINSRSWSKKMGIGVKWGFYKYIVFHLVGVQMWLSFGKRHPFVFSKKEEV